MKEKMVLVVTRHPSLVDYLVDQGLVGPLRLDKKIITHASPEDVRGRHVIGVLPLHLAAEAASVTEIPLAVPPEWRGRELTLAELNQIAGPPARYTITKESGG